MPVFRFDFASRSLAAGVGLGMVGKGERWGRVFLGQSVVGVGSRRTVGKQKAES